MSEGGVIHHEAVFVDTFREYFLSLRELGATSKVRVLGLFVPKKLLQPKRARIDTGSSLLYVEPFRFTYSSIVPLSALCRIKPLEPLTLFPLLPPLVSLESTG